MSQTKSDPRGLRDIVSEKAEDGSWVFPLVREDRETIKNKQAGELLHVEQMAASVEARADSLELELMVALARDENKWYDNLEIGIIAGAVIVIFSGWGLGQVAN